MYNCKCRFWRQFSQFPGFVLWCGHWKKLSGIVSGGAVSRSFNTCIIPTDKQSVWKQLAVSKFHLSYEHSLCYSCYFICYSVLWSNSGVTHCVLRLKCASSVNLIAFQHHENPFYDVGWPQHCAGAANEGAETTSRNQTTTSAVYWAGFGASFFIKTSLSSPASRSPIIMLLISTFWVEQSCGGCKAKQRHNQITI